MRNFFRSRYVRELERRLAVLERDNRNLINSLLGTGGVPPLPDREPGVVSGAPLAPRRPMQRPRTMAQVLRRHETADLKKTADHEAQIREAMDRARQQKRDNAQQGGEPNGQRQVESQS